MVIAYSRLLHLDALETSELFDDQGFAELFPVSHTVGSQPPPVEASASNSLAPVSSLFDDGIDAANLFNAPNNFPIAKQEQTSLDSISVQPALAEVQTSSLSGVDSVPVAGTEDVLDDLDFIDDSEFMAAFSSPSNVTSPQTAQTQPSAQQFVAAQPPQNRYLPQTAIPYSPPNAYAPHVASLPSNLPANVATTAVRSTSSKYEPSTAARPSTGGTSATQSPQVSVTQPAWNQPVPPSSQANRPAPKSTSSFVTAKGGYSSPYDLPPQIASKAKRPTPAPIPTPTYQRFPDVRGPLSADLHAPPPPVGPPPRAMSAQPHFPAQQNFPPPPSQPQQSNFYPPSQVASPPPQFPGQTSYAPPQVMSPPIQNTQPARSDPYAPVKPASPPVQRTPRTMLSQGQHLLSQNTAAVPASQSLNSVDQYRFAPDKSASPPAQYAPAGRNLHAPGTVVSPPYQSASSGVQQVGTGVYQQTGHPPNLAGTRYGPTQAAGPQRSVSIPQPSQRAAYLGDLPADLSASRYAPNRATSPSIHTLHPNIAQSAGVQTRNLPQYVVNPQVPPRQASQPPQPPQPHQYPGPTDTFAQHSVHHTTFVEDDPNSDLPPHFEMERDGWDQTFDPEGLIDPSEQFIDRTIQETPEPMDHRHLDALSDVSPPRPWERAASLRPQSPPKPRPFSPYDPKMASHVAPPVPPSTTGRQRSISPLAVRETPYSPKKDAPVDRAPMDRSQSYPSRKPPAHLKFPAPSSTQSARTVEDDFQSKRGGYPIVSFGFGGKLITMIPRTPHRVNIHGVAPLAVPGNITFSNVGDIVEPPAQAISFPGPLFVAGKPVKGRAKDIGTWLDASLARLETMRESPNLVEEEILQIEDKKVLIKLLRILVDNNGALDGRLASFCFG